MHEDTIHIPGHDDESLSPTGIYAGKPLSTDTQSDLSEIRRIQNSELFKYIVDVLLARNIIKDGEQKPLAQEIAEICVRNRDPEYGDVNSGWRVVEFAMQESKVAADFELHLKAILDTKGVRDLVVAWVRGFFPNETTRDVNGFLDAEPELVA